ncbi:MAG TPA: WhiB family transcriptional regulator [Actinomycetota bacterium]|nr:WhiB family transcriptional regulator [Actinomycetota bacterium]
MVERVTTGSDGWSDGAQGWRFRAACRGEDAALFFAPNYFERKEEKDAREARAKAICRRCEVRAECLAYALRTREPHGIWGGLNELERRLLLRELERRAG